jgi:hypothetical protein
MRRKWRKHIPRFRLQQNKEKLYQGTQQSPQEHSERTNPAHSQWEFHRNDTRHGQWKCTGDTKEIPRQQKSRTWESTRTNKRNHIIPE